MEKYSIDWVYSMVEWIQSCETGFVLATHIKQRSLYLILLVAMCNGMDTNLIEDIIKK